MTSYERGWDIFMTKPGACDTMRCRVCGEKMEVERDVFGPTSYAESLGKMRQRLDPTYRVGHLHDAFICKNSGQTWHSQALELRKEQAATHSTRLTAMLEEEIRQILTTRRPTTASHADVDSQTLPGPTGNGAPHGLL